MDADRVYRSWFYCPFCETWSVTIEVHALARDWSWWQAHCNSCHAFGPADADGSDTPQGALGLWMKIVPEGIEIPESNTGILYGKLPEEDSDGREIDLHR